MFYVAKKSGGINLTDEDKNLLQRWANMQNVNKNTTQCSDTQPSTVVAHQEPNGRENTTQLNTSSTVQQGNARQTITLQEPFADITTQQPLSQVVIQQPENANIATENSVHIVNNVSGKVPVYSTITTSNPSQHHSEKNIPANELHHSYSPLTNPLDSILETLASHSSNNSNNQCTSSEQFQQSPPLVSTASKPPPSYTEAVTAKLHSTMSPEQPQQLHPFTSVSLPNDPSSIETMMLTGNNQIEHNSSAVPFSNQDIIRAMPGSSYVPFQTYSPSDLVIGDNQVVLPSVSGSDGSADGGGQLLSVITRQMMKSHVDDLTLTKTPKGTGGGYGVGLDLETVMTESGKDMVQPDK